LEARLKADNAWHDHDLVFCTFMVITCILTGWLSDFSSC
jgi:hypothetical protein